ncbi:MAG: AMP-binding protein, partial [Nevskiales bacterium]
RYTPPPADELMTLVYTSGTTGNPKGVMMSYGNFAFAARAFLQWFPSEGNERLFSYLPLAHLLERACIEMGSLIWHAEVEFLENIDSLAEQLAKVAPTRFFGVPLVYGRIQAGVLQKLPEAKLKRLMKIPLVKQLLRRKILKAIGFHNVRSCVSGAAPMPVSTMAFFRNVLGIELLEGYGMTENMAYLSACLPGQVRIGSVGKPFPDAGVKLSDEGEILCKHAGCTKGYYKQADKTAETFTQDGYLRTGDKGRLDEDGYLYITGRVKDIFKTAKGKYVAPAPVEGAMARNTYIDQLCLVGMNLTQPIMVTSLTEEGRKQSRETLQQQLLADMEAVNQELEAHERMAKLLVVSDTWLPDNGFMTPTMKVKRNVIEERYAEAITTAAADRSSLIEWL